MSKHTPGPWTVHHRMRDCVTFEGKNGTENLFMQNLDGYFACQNKYDARLIAAAPELLEALKPFAELLKKHHDSMSDDRPIFAIEGSIITAVDLRKAVAAIAKAEGKQ